jgi:hypothetical protein
VRYLSLIASALWPPARTSARHARRRGSRVRRYASRPLAPRPHVITGPIPLPTPRMVSKAEIPPLPPRPVLPWETERTPEPVDVLQLGRVDRSQLGVRILPGVSCQGKRPGRHRRTVAA